MDNFFVVVATLYAFTFIYACPYRMYVLTGSLRELA